MCARALTCALENGEEREKESENEKERERKGKVESGGRGREKKDAFLTHALCVSA